MKYGPPRLNRRAWRLVSIVLATELVALAPAPVHAAAAWEQWQPVPGAIDIHGPRSDGSLVVAGAAALYVVDAAGKMSPFARGPGGYRDDRGLEAYLSVSPAAHVAGADCDFAPDDIYVLRLHFPFGITRVDATGEDSGSFTNIPGVSTLWGLVFDSVGSFDHRLLVSANIAAKAVIYAIDCNGTVTVVARTALTLEGGLAVAPNGFGSFGGALITPEETTGTIYAIGPDGTVRVVIKPSALPASVGKTLESVAFVPPGFMARGGAVYYADVKSPGNAFPGSDHILRLTSAELQAAGVQDGDLLAATESGGALIAIRCEATCSTRLVVAPTQAHGEGHLAFSMQSPQPSPSPSRAPVKTTQGGLQVPASVLLYAGLWGIPTVAFVLLVALLAAVAVQALRRRGS